MRIDDQINIPATDRTNVADLLGRLDTGDVIKAKVLDISSGEVVLRLFDGSVLKAATTEGLEAKVGQTLTLAVTSRTGGTLFLETVKESAQSGNISTDILKNILSVLQIKPDAKNLELAAEFMKAGITATAIQFDRAAGLMESFKGLNAEKAVFITSGGLQTDQIKLELLTKLLDGNLKIGQQIIELQTALENAGKVTGKNGPDTALTKAIIEAIETAFASKASSPSNTAIHSSQPSQLSQQAANLNSSAAEGQLSMEFSETASEQASTKTDGSGKAVSAAAAKTGPASQQGNTAVLPVTVVRQGAVNTFSESAASEPVNASNISSASTALNASTSSNPDGPDSLAENTNQNADRNGLADIKDLQVNNDMVNASRVQYSALSADGDKPASRLNNFTDILQDDSIYTPNRTDSSSTDPFAKLVNAMKELFVNINSDKLASDLDVNKLHNDISNKLNMLKAAIQTSDFTGLPGGEGILSSTALLDDSVKLINQLNNNNILYYQLPVSLSGRNTTAELYIMKRQQNKKRIDPQNAVLFVSLDTDNLGRVETLLDVNGKNVSISLRTEKQQINDFVKENIKYLYSGLADCGYKLANIKYALIDLATPPMKQEQLLSKMLSANHNKVDMRI